MSNDGPLVAVTPDSFPLDPLQHSESTSGRMSSWDSHSLIDTPPPASLVPTSIASDSPHAVYIETAASDSSSDLFSSLDSASSLSSGSPQLLHSPPRTDSFHLTWTTAVIMRYQPGPQATMIWAVSESRLITNTECECGNADPESPCKVWKLWDRMSNIAEALAGAEHFGAAFDLHHLCFIQIFTNAEPLLLKHEE